MRWLLVLLLLLPADKILAAGEEKTYIIQEWPPVYWYYPLHSPNLFWWNLFDERYNCQEMKKYTGKPCEPGEPDVEKIDPCLNVPPGINVGFCFRPWQGYSSESFKEK